MSANIVISLTYYEKILLRSYANEIRPYRIASSVEAFYSTPADESLSALYNVFFILSFLVMWVATMALLNQYKYKLGFSYLLREFIVPICAQFPNRCKCDIYGLF